MKIRHLFVALLTLSLCCFRSFAWIDTGHKVVALIAWEDLTPKTRSVVTALLKQHPRYDKDLLQDATADESPDDQARTVFATAATWPDMVRSPANPMNHVANHPAWHYIDIPFIEGGVTAPPDNDKTPGPHNIVEALTQCTNELKDGKNPDAQKAIDVCWVAHLVGDIHQPLHAADLFSPDQPDGDKGGNADFVLRDGRYRNTMANLHLIWDSLPGDFRSEELIGYEARGLRADPGYSREKLKDLLAVTDFMAWAKESHQLAVDDVYLNGNIKFALAQGRGSPDVGAVPGLPPGYLLKAEHVAMHQVALAGYRLADELNAIFDPSKPASN